MRYMYQQRYPALNVAWLTAVYCSLQQSLGESTSLVIAALAHLATKLAIAASSLPVAETEPMGQEVSATFAFSATICRCSHSAYESTPVSILPLDYDLDCASWSSERSKHEHVGVEPNLELLQI